MAEDSDLEKTEPASPRRLEKAREEGQVARSPELGTFAVLASGCAALWLLGDQLAGGLIGLVRGGLSFDRSSAFGDGAMVERLATQGGDGLFTTLPVLGILLIAALFAPMLLNGWLISAKPLQPDFSRLDPLKGLARIFSLSGLVELVKALAKTAVVGGIAAGAIWYHTDAIVGLSGEATGPALAHAARLLLLIAASVALGMALIVAIDVPFQLWNHARKLRMSKEEVRRESKENDGDPQIKARIRALQREAARKRMMAEVPKADVIVTNPTHYAVALSYKEGGSGAPRVVAKGSQLIAARIRELGAEHRVPIVEAPPLARALHRHTEIGDEIPQALYTAVAEVLAYVYQLRRYDAVGGRAPAFPGQLPVPPELDPGIDAR
jgi:flagellar biosynthesis protein FlhB